MTYRIKKSVAFLLTLIVISSLALSACSKSSSNSASTEDDSDKPVKLKLAHQFASVTDGEGDYRSLLADRFAKEVEERSNGSIQIEVYPADSLMKGKEHYSALQKGSLDMAVYLPFYDAGKVNEFSISLMPGIIKNSAEAWKWPGSKIGDEVEGLLDNNGIKMLVWTWAPTTLATKGKKENVVKEPSDLKGLKLRGAGNDSEQMFEDLGAGIASMASSELYSALQTGVLDGTLTSYSSFMSYRLFEVVDNFLYPDDNAIMYALMPLVISSDVYDNKLNEEQKAIVDEVSAELQEWVIEAVEEDNSQVVQTFKDNGVNVYEISPEESKKWFEAAQPTVEKFAESSEEANRLIKAARELNE
ncbi:hypothetical protein CSV61_15975 [Sporosarcina sp. P3]|uniref:TRAP transporter substrate-binding protein DctP n=1 Tax=Sporosarcina TaxID=1569 RepID=UPI0009DC63AE|nr:MULTISPECIES: TRAP transporter substrate-binding protein DctP [Sporosarcina]ARF17799.1 hypothetical protein SporoP17a_11275 [Sporosarcina ureae]PID20178.1 hypothetical protein CSV61_15975 [Sporosarcina sp. P3]